MEEEYSEWMDHGWFLNDRFYMVNEWLYRLSATAVIRQNTALYSFSTTFQLREPFVSTRMCLSRIPHLRF